MSYKEFIENVEESLEGLYGKQEGRAIAVRLLQHYCGISSYEHIINPCGEISEEHMILLLGATKELLTARPLQYFLGFEEFYGRNFLVEEGVLIPRPETEELVRWVLEDFRSGNLSISGNLINSKKNSNANTSDSPQTRMLDAACGSGCIGITLACEVTDSQVFALDFSSKAIEITRRNAMELIGNRKELKVDKKPCFSVLKGDLLAGPLSQNTIDKHSLDIIVSNPPYVLDSERAQMRKNVLDFEPEEALFVADDNPLKFYKALAIWGITLLKPDGSIYLEINESYGNGVVELLKSNGFSDVIIRKDFSGKDRMVRGRLVAR